MIVCIGCAYYDLRWRRIPNTIVLSAIVAGLVLHGVAQKGHGLLNSSIGMIVGGGAFLIIYVLGAIGAGDVKMMAGVGALMGLKLILPVIFYTAIMGGIMALIIMACAKIKFGDKVKFNFMSIKKSARERAENAGIARRTLPYGVAIASGTIVTQILSLMGRLP